MKISELAREANEHIHRLGYYHIKDEERMAVIQNAMNAYAQEACKPLVEALVKINQLGADSIFSVANQIAELARDTVLTHRLAYGQEEKE